MQSHTMSNFADRLPCRHLRLHVDEGVLTVAFDRPEVLNALHRPAHEELSHVFDAFAADPSLRVAIVTGSGPRAFCVGTDLKSLAITGPYDYPPGGFGGLTTRFDLDKPVIAAVNGLCMGGGVEIVAACDIAVACAHARFALPEPRVGLAALGGGGLQRLARQAPAKQLMAFALTGLPVDADAALRLGLVGEVVPEGTSLARARAIARAIAECAPLAITATRRVILDSVAEPDLARAIGARYPAAERMLASEDAREGPAAFAARRAPRWQGR